MKNNAKLINHESIHLRQQAELLVIPFYLWYLTEYFIRLALCRDRKQAYKNISFEQEAYNNDTNLNYLQNKPLWSFIKFINQKV